MLWVFLDQNLYCEIVRENVLNRFSVNDLVKLLLDNIAHLNEHQIGLLKKYNSFTQSTVEKN